jgi:hypothetical protein
MTAGISESTEPVGLRMLVYHETCERGAGREPKKLIG